MPETSSTAVDQAPAALRGLPGLPGVPLPEDYRVYRWGWAPQGLATRRQLATLGLRPGRRGEPAAEISWRHGTRRTGQAAQERVAYLYPVAEAAPKQAPTPAQTAALAAAMRVRRTCTRCGVEAGYCLPTRFTGRRECLDCLDDTTQASAEDSAEASAGRTSPTSTAAHTHAPETDSRRTS